MYATAKHPDVTIDGRGWRLETCLDWLFFDRLRDSKGVAFPDEVSTLMRLIQADARYQGPGIKKPGLLTALVRLKELHEAQRCGACGMRLSRQAPTDALLCPSCHDEAVLGARHDDEEEARR